MAALTATMSSSIPRFRKCGESRRCGMLSLQLACRSEVVFGPSSKVAQIYCKADAARAPMTEKSPTCLVVRMRRTIGFSHFRLQDRHRCGLVNGHADHDESDAKDIHCTRNLT